MSLESLLARQAPFTMASAEREGVSRQRLRTAVQRGDLRRGCHGVYVPALVPEGQPARLAVQALLLPPGAAFSHGTAAALLAEGLDLPERLTVTVPPPARGPGRPCLRAVRAVLPAEDVLRLGEAPATSPVRTVLDLGCAVSSFPLVTDTFRAARGVSLTRVVSLVLGTVLVVTRNGARSRTAVPRGRSPRSWARRSGACGEGALLPRVRGPPDEARCSPPPVAG